MQIFYLERMRHRKIVIINFSDFESQPLCRSYLYSQHQFRPMPRLLLLLFFIAFIGEATYAQGTWSQCNVPFFKRRVDDVFMVNDTLGYAVCGDGQIVKTTDGFNWSTIAQDTNVYCRSVEFINEQKGFVGAFTKKNYTQNILRRTTDGGTTWTDLTTSMDSLSRKGICGLAVADSNTIYGCGNYFQDSAYIIKSIDGGNTWSFIDMKSYATHLIDITFLNKDTGFVTGSGLLPLQSAIILYTKDGGQSWSTKYQDTASLGYIWKIQNLDGKHLFAAKEEGAIVYSRILTSTDSGMSWSVYKVVDSCEYIQGIGFIDSLHGWTGGWGSTSFESFDGGKTWIPLSVCPWMNRVQKVTDSLMFASGNSIWRYDAGVVTGTHQPINDVDPEYISVNCYPNPSIDETVITVELKLNTRMLLMLLDAQGRRVKLIENCNLPKGIYQYRLNTKELPSGNYHVFLKSHEDRRNASLIVTH